MADAPTDERTDAATDTPAAGSPRAFRLGRDVLTVDSPTDLPMTRSVRPLGEAGGGEANGGEANGGGSGGGEITDDGRPGNLATEGPAKPGGPSLRLFDGEEPPRRPAWRQRLVDAERGFSHSFRSESTLTAYFCAAGAGLLMAGVLRVTAIEGAVLLVAFTQAVFVELGRIAVREMTTREAKAHRVMATASVMAAVTGLGVAALTLGRRLLEAWG